MIYQANEGQVTYGESIGILMLDTFVPFIPGDVGNASTFSFPVRYKTVAGLTFKKLYQKKTEALPEIIDAGKELVAAGVKAITTDCGFMILYQQELTNALGVPVFTSSLLQLSFIEKIITANSKIGVITAEASKLNHSLLNAAGVGRERVAVKGMEDKIYFAEAVIEEKGVLDSNELKKETVAATRELVTENPAVSVILLECSMLSPYAKAVQDTVMLPVFDYVTMIEFVYQSLVKKRFAGFM